MRTDSPEQRCDKPNCGDPAAASFSFRYDTGEVWIGDLAEPHPSRYDLCHYHAEHLTAPRGWERIDERTASVEHLPFAAETGQAWGQVAVGGGSVSPGGGGGGTVSSGAGSTGRPGNRYAALSAELPRLAAEVQASEEADDAASDSEASRVGPPITSRELSPMPADAPGAGGVVLDFDRPRERRDAAHAEPRAADPVDGEDRGDEDPTGEDVGDEDPDGDDPPPDPATG